MGDLIDQVGKFFQWFCDAIAWVCKAIAVTARWTVLLCTHPAWDVVRAVEYRYRDLYPPLVILAVLVGIRWCADGARPEAVLVLTLLASSAIVFRVRRRLDRQVEWIYALSCLGAIIFGATLISILGTDNRLLNVLSVVGWIAGASIWWTHHHVRGTAPAIASPIIELWDSHIGVDIKAEKEAERKKEAEKKKRLAKR